MQRPTARQRFASWLKGHDTIGITAGASAPEILVQEVIARLRQEGAESVTELQGMEEPLVFPLPRGLK